MNDNSPTTYGYCINNLLEINGLIVRVKSITWEGVDFEHASNLMAQTHSHEAYLQPIMCTLQFLDLFRWEKIWNNCFQLQNNIGFEDANRYYWAEQEDDGNLYIYDCIEKENSEPQKILILRNPFVHMVQNLVMFTSGTVLDIPNSELVKIKIKSISEGQKIEDKQ